MPVDAPEGTATRCSASVTTSTSTVGLPREVDDVCPNGQKKKPSCYPAQDAPPLERGRSDLELLSPEGAAAAGLPPSAGEADDEGGEQLSLPPPLDLASARPLNQPPAAGRRYSVAVRVLAPKLEGDYRSGWLRLLGEADEAGGAECRADQVDCSECRGVLYIAPPRADREAADPAAAAWAGGWLLLQRPVPSARAPWRPLRLEIDFDDGDGSIEL